MLRSPDFETPSGINQKVSSKFSSLEPVSNVKYDLREICSAMDCDASFCQVGPYSSTAGESRPETTKGYTRKLMEHLQETSLHFSTSPLSELNNN